MDKAALIQKVWPEWKLGRELGEGSFGAVYEAERIDSNGSIKSAIKFISIPKSEKEIFEARADGMDEKSATDYFKSIMEELVREFITMEMLSGNKNVVMHEDHAVIQRESEIGWDILIRMELLTPFKEYMLDRELDEETVIRLGMDMCSALVACEKYKVVHRDIKPENIFVSKDGNFKLGDFGVARTVEKTSSGMSIKGTISYMAPEVYRGMAYNATVDIYSLGIMMYRLVNNNRSPFLPPAPAPIKYKDKEIAEMRRISGEVFPDAACASPELMRIIRKAAAYEPSERYSIAGKMLYDLSELNNIIKQRKENGELIAKSVPKAFDIKEGMVSAFLEEEETISVFSNDNSNRNSMPYAFDKQQEPMRWDSQMPMGQPGPMNPQMPMGQPGPMNPQMPMGQPGPMNPQMLMMQPGPMDLQMPMGQSGTMNQQMPMGQPGPMNPQMSMMQPGPMDLQMPMGQPGPMNQQMPMGQPGPMNPQMPMGQSGPMNPQMPMGQPGPMVPQGDQGVYHYTIQQNRPRRRLKPIAIVGIVLGSILLLFAILATI